MLTVGSPLSGALAALNVLAPSQVQTDVSPSARANGGNALTGVSRMRLSSSASEALLKFSEYAAAAKGASVEVSIAPAKSKPAHASGIPADKVAWLDSLGADSWIVRDPPRMDDATFEKQVLAGLVRNGSPKLAGFSEALAAGTLNIQRASDMPELGYKSFQVTLFKDGKECGGAGFSVCNNERWVALRESGIYAGTGTVEGNDYVATWPMPAQGGDTADDPGTYGA